MKIIIDPSQISAIDDTCNDQLNQPNTAKNN